MADEVQKVASDAEVSSYALLMKNIAEFGRFSFELEEKREQSLITQSGHLLTALSVFSAALLMALPEMIEHTVVPAPHLLTALGIVLIPLVGSFVLCVLTQWRFGYQTMKTAMELLSKAQADLQNLPTQAQYDYQWGDQLTEIQTSKKRVNDKRVRFIKAAICSFIIAIGFLVAACLLFMVIYA